MFGTIVLCEKKKRIKQPALQELYFFSILKMTENEPFDGYFIKKPRLD